MLLPLTTPPWPTHSSPFVPLCHQRGLFLYLSGITGFCGYLLSDTLCWIGAPGEPELLLLESVSPSSRSFLLHSRHLKYLLLSFGEPKVQRVRFNRWSLRVRIRLPSPLKTLSFLVSFPSGFSVSWNGGLASTTFLMQPLPHLPLSPHRQTEASKGLTGYPGKDGHFPGAETLGSGGPAHLITNGPHSLLVTSVLVQRRGWWGTGLSGVPSMPSF